MFINQLSRDNQMRVADASFGVMALFGFVGIVVDAFDRTHATPNAPFPMMTAVGVCALMIIVGSLLARVAMLDKSRSEEYVYQTMASGAIVAVMSTIVIIVAWTTDFLLEPWLGAPSPSQIIALLLGSWAIGYFTYRVKGVRE